MCLYVFRHGVVVVFSLPSVLSLWCCLVALDRYSRVYASLKIILYIIEKSPRFAAARKLEFLQRRRFEESFNAE